MPTINQALRDAERALAFLAEDDEDFDTSSAPRIEAEALLRDILAASRAQLLVRLGDELTDAQAATFRAAVRRRVAREPLAYIVGRGEFYGLELACTPAALIPRWETEMLVELPLERARCSGAAIRVADVGTGTGAIATAVAANARNVEVAATDVSNEALALADVNVERHGVRDRVSLVRADLLDGLGVVDVIVANLPYISEAEWPGLAPEIRDHEPKAALVAGASGLEIIERLLRVAPAHLSRGGVLAAEIGASHGAAARRIARAHFPDAAICVTKDLAGHDRVLEVRT
jgi:release factor glutamine methyltransferase